MEKTVNYQNLIVQTDKFIDWNNRVRDYSELGCLRIGQSYMNALYDVDPALYEIITGSTADCFYDSSKCEEFLREVGAAWGVLNDRSRSRITELEELLDRVKRVL